MYSYIYTYTKKWLEDSELIRHLSYLTPLIAAALPISLAFSNFASTMSLEHWWRNHEQKISAGGN